MKKRAATMCLFITALIWGLAFVAQERGARLLPSFTFNGLRFAMGSFSLIPVLFFFERGKSDTKKQKYTVMLGIVCGLVLFAAASFQQAGMSLLSKAGDSGVAGKAGFITGLYMIIVPIIGIFMGRKTTKFTWIGAVFACIGLYLLCASDGIKSIGLGDLILLVGAFFWAGHIILIDKYVNKISMLKFAALQFLVCSFASMVCALIFEPVISASAFSAAIFPLLFCGVLSVGVAYTLQIIGQKGVPPAKAAIIFSLESVFSALGGVIITGDAMSVQGYIGCACIFVGIILSVNN